MGISLTDQMKAFLIIALMLVGLTSNSQTPDLNFFRVDSLLSRYIDKNGEWTNWKLIANSKNTLISVDMKQARIVIHTNDKITYHITNLGSQEKSNGFLLVNFDCIDNKGQKYKAVQASYNYNKHYNLYLLQKDFEMEYVFDKSN
jgi:hypothetical protein